MQNRLTKQEIDNIRQRNNRLLAGIDLSETAIAKAPKVSKSARDSLRKAASKAISEARQQGLFQTI